MAAAQEEEFNWNLNIDAAVGIDLGTTYSCVAVYKDGCITVISDENGNKLMPSVVAIMSNTGRIQKLVGHDATGNTMDASQIITEIKRLIGRKFNEPAVQMNVRRWPFLVTANHKGNPQVNMYLDGQPDLKYSPEEISSCILEKMKKYAENYLKQEVTHAVVTVPAYFNESQRQATFEAARLANLKLLAIINEPSAGALAYGVRSKVTKKRNILVMDVGGGTSDVALIEVVGENFTVLAFKGDNNLGGEDFDSNLVNYCLEHIKQKQGSNFLIGKLLMRRLRNKCEHVKRELSRNPADPNWHYVLELEDVEDGVDFTLSISRKKFEEINKELFTRALALVPSCLRKANLSIGDISDLVPVGGSMRIPKLREMLQNLFQGKQLYDYINPDEAIAVGAAILAAKKIGNYCGHLMLSDITPLSLGVCADIDDRMSVIIPKNSKIPFEKTERYVTAHNFQTTGAIKVYQGENEFVRDNILLGSFNIEGLESASAGKTEIDVTLKVDANGILKVTAKEVATEKENVVTRDWDSLLPSLNMLSIT